MAVALPTLSDLAEVKPRLLDNAAVLTPALGGPVQRVARLGSRFSVDVTLPPLVAADAGPWLAAVMKSRTEAATLTLTMPQAAPLTSLGASPVVNGASQTGARLNASGFNANQVIPAGRFFSFNTGSRTYLHMTTLQVTANGAGQVQLHIAPMLRVSPANALALEFTSPTIEGFLDGNSSDWSLERMLWTSTGFTLTENE